MPNPPAHAKAYRFESVEVKESSFRIDGVFLPPEEISPKVIFFIEVQFQKDRGLQICQSQSRRGRSHARC